MSLSLVIGNKAYSSWSLRPWLALRQLEIPFKERQIVLRQADTKAAILREGGAGTVPILHDGDVTVWESLAILEYLNATWARGRLWPERRAAMAYARAISAEMHAGFGGLRSHCPMNVRRRREPYALSPAAAADVARIAEIWSHALQTHGENGPFLFGEFSAADAMYAPVVMRLHFYAVPLDAPLQRYVDTILALPAVGDWIAAAQEEPWVIEESERY